MLCGVRRRRKFDVLYADMSKHWNEKLSDQSRLMLQNTELYVLNKYVMRKVGADKFIKKKKKEKGSIKMERI